MKKYLDLRTTRKAAGLTLERLSESTGLTIPSLSFLETGTYPAKKETIMKIENIIGQVNWCATFAGPDREHLVTIMKNLLNNEEDPEGLPGRIRFLRQLLRLMQFEYELHK